MPEDDTITEEGRHARLFADWLVEQRNGLLHAELSDALNELVAAVNQHGRGGEVHLKIKVKPAAKTRGAVAVSDDVVVKKPAGDRGDALFFVDKHNNLRRENPEQPRLPLHEVPAPSTSMKDVTPAKEA